MNKLALSLVGCLIFWAVLLIALPGLAVACIAAGLLLVLVLWLGAEAMGANTEDGRD